MQKSIEIKHRISKTFLTAGCLKLPSVDTPLPPRKKCIKCICPFSEEYVAEYVAGAEKDSVLTPVC